MEGSQLMQIHISIIKARLIFLETRSMTVVLIAAKAISLKKTNHQIHMEFDSKITYRGKTRKNQSPKS